MILLKQWGEFKVLQLHFYILLQKFFFVHKHREHPLAALSHGDVSVVSSFNVGDTFSECLNTGDTSRYLLNINLKLTNNLIFYCYNV